MSVEDKRALDTMDSQCRVIEGRYEIPMLWKSSETVLHNNRAVAESRLKGLKGKLNQDKTLLGKYRKVMEAHVANGHTRKLTQEEENKQSNHTWYLPHHPVFNPNKPDKVRVVFDAAASYHGTSLSARLVHGPDLTNSLVGVFIRFRQEPIAIIADIEAMFHQVKVPAQDCDALRFL